MVTAAVSRCVTPSSWSTPSDCQIQQQQQLRNWRHCSSPSSLVVSCGHSRSCIGVGGSSSSFSPSSSQWSDIARQNKVLGRRGDNSVRVAGVQAETEDEVTGSRTGLTIGQALVQGLREEMEDDAIVMDGPLGFTYAAVFDGHVGFDAVKFLK
jgi:hypothetical protein